MSVGPLLPYRSLPIQVGSRLELLGVPESEAHNH